MKRIYLTLATALFLISTYSQSGTCAGATELTNDGEFSFTSGDTTGKGNEGGNSSPDVFYYVTPGAFQTVNIGLCGANDFDSQLRIYTDCTLTTTVAENDSTCGLQAQVSFQSDDTSTYIILVEGADNPLDINTGNPGGIDFGAFEISVWFEAPVATPDAAVGISCTPSASGPSVLFSDEMDDNSGGWTGDIVYSGNANGFWEVISSGGATSLNTGPSSAYSGTTYMNFEASGSGSASAVTPAINLEGSIVEDVELTFYMHAYGSEMGTLDVGVGISSSGPFTTLMSWSGQFQSAETDPWFQVGVDLSAYIGQTIFIEFLHTDTVSGFHGDMSIDLVEVAACDAVLEVEEEDLLNNVSIYPNPTKGILNFKAQDAIETISVYNLLGQEVMRVNPNTIQIQIDLESLSIGVYVVKVQVGNQIGSYKIVKQ